MITDLCRLGGICLMFLFEHSWLINERHFGRVWHGNITAVVIDLLRILDIDLDEETCVPTHVFIRANIGE